MFGALLFIGAQIGGEQCVLFIVFAAFAGARDGVGIDGLAGDLNEHFGGGTDELYLVKVVVEHIGRGIDLPQTAIEEKRRARDLLTETEGRHRLKNVARIDMLLDRVDHVQEIFRCRFVTRHKVDWCFAFCGLCCRWCERCGKACTHHGKTLHNGIIEFACILTCADIGKVVELSAVFEGIVDDEIAAHHELPK